MIEVELATTKPEVKKILLVGNEGSGKTRFIGTMPKPICICSFDKGISTLYGQDGIKAYVFMDDDRRNPKAWSEFISFYNKLKLGQVKYKDPKTGKEEPYKTLAIDSITALSKFILDHANFVNNTVDAKVVGFEPYTRTKSFLQDVVIKSVLASEYFVCTAILESNKDEKTGQIFFQPSTEGRFREEMGQWFDAVGFMAVDIGADKKPKFTMDLVGDRSRKAKIRLPSLPANGLIITDPSYDKLNALIAQVK